MLAEVSATFRRREVWVAVALFVSPAGAGALMVLFPAVAIDYAASVNIVIWVVGVGGAVMTAAGALAGGVLCERFGAWRVYPAAGVGAALCAFATAFGSQTLPTYIAGSAAYAFVIGTSYASFMALALEMLGAETAGSGTRFTLFIAATNVPLVYMTWVDGAAHAAFGVTGMLVADGVANGVFGVLLLMCVWRRDR
jgi:MFS family permease